MGKSANIGLRARTENGRKRVIRARGTTTRWGTASPQGQISREGEGHTPKGVVQGGETADDQVGTRKREKGKLRRPRNGKTGGGNLVIMETGQEGDASGNRLRGRTPKRAGCEDTGNEYVTTKTRNR